MGCCGLGDGETCASDAPSAKPSDAPSAKPSDAPTPPATTTTAPPPPPPATTTAPPAQTLPAAPPATTTAPPATTTAPVQTQPVGDSGEFGQGDGDFTEGGAGMCADNTKKNSCKDAGCTWDGKSSPKCQPGGSGGEGEDEAEAVKAPKCKKLKTEDECKANKKTCKWKGDKCKDK